jgi:hypothetical protein
MDPLCVQLGRVLIQLTKSLDVCVAWLQLLGLLALESITGLIGVKVRFVVKNGRDCNVEQRDLAIRLRTQRTGNPA